MGRRRRNGTSSRAAVRLLQSCMQIRISDWWCFSGSCEFVVLMIGFGVVGVCIFANQTRCSPAA